jgi:hypothetical protein
MLNEHNSWKETVQEWLQSQAKNVLFLRTGETCRPLDTIIQNQGDNVEKN